MARLTIGSRGSQLARWQAEHIAAQLRARGHQVEIEIITTTGDRVLDVPLAQVGTKGMFTKEIEDALRERRVDLAVHSLKDLPTQLPEGFAIGAVTEREDPRDAMVSPRFGGLQALPRGARVGTSSLRRQAQLKAWRSDLELLPLRGNVDTRLRKLQERQYDAVILAAAGLRRLGRMEAVREIVPPEMLCPAVGQGALAVEVRADDAQTRELVTFLDHAPTRAATDCERALLRALGGGCQVPVGGLAVPRGNELDFIAVVARPDGSKVLREAATGAEPEALGRSVAEALLKKGAAEILREVYGRPVAVPQQP
jgi:hydroxymethylbilane synthase